MNSPTALSATRTYPHCSENVLLQAKGHKRFGGTADVASAAKRAMRV